VAVESIDGTAVDRSSAVTVVRNAPGPGPLPDRFVHGVEGPSLAVRIDDRALSDRNRDRPVVIEAYELLFVSGLHVQSRGGMRRRDAAESGDRDSGHRTPAAPVKNRRRVLLSREALPFDDELVSFISTAESTMGRGKTVLTRASKVGPAVSAGVESGSLPVRFPQRSPFPMSAIRCRS